MKMPGDLLTNVDRAIPPVSAVRLTDPERVALASELRTAVQELRERGLYQAAKWASELLNSLPPHIRKKEAGSRVGNALLATDIAGTPLSGYGHGSPSIAGHGGLSARSERASRRTAGPTFPSPNDPDVSTSSTALRSALDRLPPPPAFARGSRSLNPSSRPRSSLNDFFLADEGEGSQRSQIDLDAEFDMDQSSMDMDTEVDTSLPSAQKNRGLPTAGPSNSNRRPINGFSTHPTTPGTPSFQALPDFDPQAVRHSTPIPSGSGGAKVGLDQSDLAQMNDRESDSQTEEEDVYLLAKSYYDAKELGRCRERLKYCKSSKARFLRTYAAYLIADKKAQELLPHFMDTKAELVAISPHLYPLTEELEGETDPYLLYLKGIFHSRLQQRDLALECFVKSVHGAPLNWSCWLSLAGCIHTSEQYSELRDHLPQGIMLAFFAISVMLDLHSATDLMMATVQELQNTFPTSVHLRAASALVLYHMRDFEEAEKVFDEVRLMDPYRMEEIETYSNMLYVMNKKAKLGQMAHEYAQIDENRAEVCCLIGNYYSARDEHVKAIQYFKRSLQLNRDYLPAWTLMGHEFVELKNSHAAIEAYRRAIGERATLVEDLATATLIHVERADVNPKDYRAWYGLGQTYELLDMHYYAIQYYNKATALRPYDCRMWSALATVYEYLKRLPDAIRCNVRALLGADVSQTMTILLKLATLYDAQGQYTDAAMAHKRYVNLCERENRDPGEMATSNLYIAQYEMNMLYRDRGADDAAEELPEDEDIENPSTETISMAIHLLEQVIASNAPEKEHAEEDLRYIKKKYGG